MHWDEGCLQKFRQLIGPDINANHHRLWYCFTEMCCMDWAWNKEKVRLGWETMFRMAQSTILPHSNITISISCSENIGCSKWFICIGALDACMVSSKRILLPGRSVGRLLLIHPNAYLANENYFPCWLVIRGQQPQDDDACIVCMCENHLNIWGLRLFSQVRKLIFRSCFQDLIRLQNQKPTNKTPLNPCSQPTQPCLGWI